MFKMVSTFWILEKTDDIDCYMAGYFAGIKDIEDLK